MAHFANVKNGVVVTVIVAEQDVIDSGLFGDPSEWVQTSYNTYNGVHYDPITGQPDGKPALRGNYAQIGSVYDPVKDAFYPPKPYPSWTPTVNGYGWRAPVLKPKDGKKYSWDEEKQTWVLDPNQ